MTSLSRHICYLLQRHDCVVVPGWGAFIAHAESACVNEDCCVGAAPRRWISFNPALATDDGVLVQSVVRREQIPYARALQMVEAEVASLKARLELDGKLAIKGVGSFISSGSEASPEFVPEAEGGVANARFAWLPELKAIPSAAVEPVRPAATAEPMMRPRFPIWGRVAAMLAVVVTLAFGIARFIPYTTANADYASMAGAKAQPAAGTSALSADSVINSAIELAIALPDERKATAAVCPLALDAPAADAYYLIVASMPSERMARKFISWMGDPSLRILNSGEGRYRVYVAEAATFHGASAYKRLPHIAGKYRDAWVCAGQ